jgi:hypothetical protein
MKRSVDDAELTETAPAKRSRGNSVDYAVAINRAFPTVRRRNGELVKASRVFSESNIGNYSIKGKDLIIWMGENLYHFTLERAPESSWIAAIPDTVSQFLCAFIRERTIELHILAYQGRLLLESDPMKLTNIYSVSFDRVTSEQVDCTIDVILPHPETNTVFFLWKEEVWCIHSYFIKRKRFLIEKTSSNKWFWIYRQNGYIYGVTWHSDAVMHRIRVMTIATPDELLNVPRFYMELPNHWVHWNRGIRNRSTFCACIETPVGWQWFSSLHVFCGWPQLRFELLDVAVHFE